MFDYVVMSNDNMAFALPDTATFVDNVTFVQYLDENTALEEVRNGNLDLYYYTIPYDRIENAQSRKNIQVFGSVGGSYSILVNPAISSSQTIKFNPFSFQEIRFALNHLIDRKLIVNELMGGFGTVMFSNYGPYDPDYLSILEQLESFNFRYDPALANKIITDTLLENGATKYNVDSKDVWMYDESPIEVTIFIRSDDPVRKAIGEILSSELERVGFKVNKDFGDLNKAFVVVYGSDPVELKWNLYTEGWGGRSAFVRYDSIGLGQMYSPWFSNMPGFNDPSYWNYENPHLDEITQKIYTGNFTSAQQRVSLIQNATLEGVKESVRIFLVGTIEQYVANENVNGIINDLGAGVPTRFTPINSRTESNSLTIGVKQIYQGAWNPVMGLNDVYSTHIWNTLYDPMIFKHPYTGENIPIRTIWNVTTAGPNDKLDIPDDAILWDVDSQNWQIVSPDVQSTSMVTFDLNFSKWHNGQHMDMNDILYSLYFTLEWGSPQQKDDKTYDSEFTPRAAQIVNTIKGIRILDHDTIEVYVDYWHFDTAEIANWASVWSVMPWEIYAAMEQAVIDGKTSFSRSGAVNKNVNWLSLLVPHDAHLIGDYLKEYDDTSYIPDVISKVTETIPTKQYVQSRYDSSIQWIIDNNHAIISNGPFYLKSYSPESRTIKVQAFADESYPYDKGHWSKFEDVKFPTITQVDIPQVVMYGHNTLIHITTKNSNIIHYFVTNAKGEQIKSGIQDIKNDTFILELDSDTADNLSLGANDLKIFAVSDEILWPDIYQTSFLVLYDDNYNDDRLSQTDIINGSNEKELGMYNNRTMIYDPSEYYVGVMIIVVITALIFLIVYRRKYNH
jgi:peptide/nickel transport system substrate-binding protein